MQQYLSQSGETRFATAVSVSRKRNDYLPGLLTRANANAPTRPRDRTVVLRGMSMRARRIKHDAWLYEDDDDDLLAVRPSRFSTFQYHLTVMGIIIKINFIPLL